MAVSRPGPPRGKITTYGWSTRGVGPRRPRRAAERCHHDVPGPDGRARPGPSAGSDSVVAGVDDEIVDAHFAHLAEGNARQARKRVAADVLIRDASGRVLMVDPTYKEGWDLPGGMIEDNESPHDGVRREVAEELRLTVTPGRPLVIEWVDAHGPWDDQIVFRLRRWHPRRRRHRRHHCDRR